MPASEVKIPDPVQQLLQGGAGSGLCLALPFQCWVHWVGCGLSCSHPGVPYVPTLHFAIH